LLALAGVTHADEELKVDAEFLEFLGSEDSDDEDWNAMLAAASKANAAKAEPVQKKEEPAPARKGES
jgi:hypothetical protein